MSAKQAIVARLVAAGCALAAPALPLSEAKPCFVAATSRIVRT